jgi:hypothetical protein
MNDLLDYLDVSGPEYDCLGHFRHAENLERGHNILAAAPQSMTPGAPPIQQLGDVSGEAPGTAVSQAQTTLTGGNQ